MNLLDEIQDRKRAMGLQIANHLEKQLASRDPVVKGTAYLVLAANLLSAISTSEADCENSAREFTNDLKNLAMEFYRRDQAFAAAQDGPNGKN